MRGSKVYTYIRNSAIDELYAIDILTNTGYLMALPVSNCSIVVTPDRTQLLAWDQDSRLYLLSILNNFTLTLTCTAALTAAASATDLVSFSWDGTLALV